MAAAPQLFYREATAADQDFLVRLYASTRAAEWDLAGWDEASSTHFMRMQFTAQATHYQRLWPLAQHSVIQMQHGAALHDVGRLWVDESDAGLRVLDLALLPDWCSRGIGATCLRTLQRRAASRGQALTLSVEQGNPARALYERLGFVPEGAEQGIHQPMRWQAEVAAAAATGGGA